MIIFVIFAAWYGQEYAVSLGIQLAADVDISKIQTNYAPLKNETLCASCIASKKNDEESPFNIEEEPILAELAETDHEAVANEINDLYV